MSIDQSSQFPRNDTGDVAPLFNVDKAKLDVASEQPDVDKLLDDIKEAEHNDRPQNDTAEQNIFQNDPLMEQTPMPPNINNQNLDNSESDHSTDASSEESSITTQTKNETQTASTHNYTHRRMGKVEEERLKREYLTKFGAIIPVLKQRNIALSIRLNSARAFKKYSLEDLKFEYDRVKNIVNMQNSVQTQRNILMTSVSLMEMLNERYNPFKFKLQGWSDTVNSNISSYDDIFQELFEKYYKEGRKTPPEIRLIMALGTSAFMCHMSHTLLSSQIPQAAPQPKPQEYASTKTDPKPSVQPPQRQDIQEILRTMDEVPSLNSLQEEDDESDILSDRSVRNVEMTT